MKKKLEVVAALMWQGEKFLICQRPQGKDLPLYWEFPGGKVESGESLEAAIVRECREELGITFALESVFGDVTHVYPHGEVHLTLLQGEIAHGDPVLLEHEAMVWIGREEIGDYMFCPADTVFLEKLSKG